MNTLRLGNLEWRLDVHGVVCELPEAFRYAEQQGDGWRLPTLEELLALRTFAYTDEGMFLQGDYGYFWSSDIDPCTRYPWAVHVVEERMATPAYDLRRVRLVREVC